MSTDIVVPQVGEAISSARLVKWYQKKGDVIRKGMPLFAVDTDKAVLDVEAFCDGILEEVLIGEDQEVQPGMVVARLRGDGPARLEPPVPMAAARELPSAGMERAKFPAPSPALAGTSSSSSQKISPRARELARQLGLDPSLLIASRPGEMIREKDVRATAERLRA